MADDLSADEIQEKQERILGIIRSRKFQIIGRIMFGLFLFLCCLGILEYELNHSLSGVLGLSDIRLVLSFKYLSLRYLIIYLYMIACPFSFTLMYLDYLYSKYYNVNESLNDDERVIFKAKKQWTSLLLPFFCLPLFTVTVLITNYWNILIVLPFIIYFLLDIINYFLGKLIVTNKRILARGGLCFSTKEIPLDNVKTIWTAGSWNLTNDGSVVIQAEDRLLYVVIMSIKHPLELRNNIIDYIKSIEGNNLK